MSSDLQLALASIQQNDYVSLAVITAVGYDYVLTFSTEIEYIWNKPWTWVSTLFVIIRYCGLYSLVLPSLVGSSFLPGPAKVCERDCPEPPDHFIHGCLQGEIINIVYEWTFLLFIGATDFVMILRVWVMYNRSRLILGILIVFFSLEILSTLLGVIIYSDPKHLTAATMEVLDVTICMAQPNTIVWTKISAMIQCTHNAVMCVLAVAQFARQSFQIYRATKRWQPNRYITLLAREGVLYFFTILLFDIIDVLGTAGEIPSGGWGFIVLTLLSNVPMYTLAPRFVMSMRALYARGDGSVGAGMDSGFGLASMSFRAGGTADETMANGDAARSGDGADDVETIPMAVGIVRPE